MKPFWSYVMRHPNCAIAAVIMIALVPSDARGQCCIEAEDPLEMDEDITLGSNDEFGKAVAIEGTTMVVGAQIYDTTESDDSGAAFVYEYVAGEWAYIGESDGELSHPEGDEFFYFGHSVGVSGDWIVCGSRADDANGSNSGSAHLFKNVSGSWEFDSTIRGSGTNSNDFFGHAVAISGTTVVVGARLRDDLSDEGAAYVFRYLPDGPVYSWQQVQKLVPDTPITDTQFGWSVAVEEVDDDEITVVIGAPTHHENGSTSERGHVYVFEWDGSTWDEVAHLTDGDDDRDLFGKSLALEGDRLVVGAPFQTVNSQSKAGLAYEFRRESGSWNAALSRTFTACDTGAQQRFGWSVDLSGEMLVVGQFAREVNPTAERSCHVYKLELEDWVHVAELDPSDPSYAGETFGWAVATDGTRAVASSTEWTESEGEYGRIYSFQGLPTEACNCPEDIDGSGMVGFGDLLEILANWGDCPADPAPCPWDLDDDDEVDVDDLDAVLAAWGNCPNVSTTSIPTLANEIDAGSCLDIDDWELFYDTMTDAEATTTEKENMLCWMDHYLNHCTPSCGYSPCNGTDPFSNPCGGH